MVKIEFWDFLEIPLNNNDKNRKSLPKDIPEPLLLVFKNYLEEHGGLHIEKDKFDSIRISVHSRATFHGFKTYSDYFDFLKTNEDEFRELISLIVVNETYFFRYPEQFSVLKEFVIPEVVSRNEKQGSRSLKVWSAGCSTGEEPFSIAISIIEAIPDWKNWEIHILGTDVSSKALAAAMKGRYGKNSFRITNEETKEKYFRKVSFDTWEIKPFIRELVTFSYHNLVKEPYPLIFMEMWDIIFCRNVTIYFKPESTRRVIENMYKSLKPGGYLFMGHTETLYNINPGFELIRFGDVFIYRKPEKNAAKKAEKPLKEVKEESVNTEITAEQTSSSEEKHISSVELADTLIKAAQTAENDETSSNLDQLEFLKSSIYTLIDEGNFKKAEEYIKKGIDLNPFDSQIHYLYGVLLRKLGLREEAEIQFKRATYLDPSNSYALMELASIKFEENNRKEALKLYLRAKNSLNHLKNNDDRFNEDLDLLLSICEMMIAELKGREE